MKNLKSILTVFLLSLLIFTSCKDNEKKVNPLVGSWELNNLELTNIPSNYISSNNVYDSYYGENKYTLMFLNDSKYERTLLFGLDIIKDVGTWKYTSELLDLNQSKITINDVPTSITGLQTLFTVNEITTETLLLSAEETTLLLPKSFESALDTLDTEEKYYNFMYEHGEEVTVTLVANFDKEN